MYGTSIPSCVSEDHTHPGEPVCPLCRPRRGVPGNTYMLGQSLRESPVFAVTPGLARSTRRPECRRRRQCVTIQPQSLGANTLTSPPPPPASQTHQNTTSRWRRQCNDWLSTTLAPLPDMITSFTLFGVMKFEPGFGVLSAAEHTIGLATVAQHWAPRR